MLSNSLINFTNKKKKVFILTGKNIFKKKNTQILINKLFKKKKIKIFKKKNFLPDILELKKIIKDLKFFEPDLFVAIGGGGVIDYAKIANSIVHIKKLDTILTRKIKFKRFTKLLVIPTTAGSGAEITPGAVLYKDKIKYNLKDQSLIPDRYFFYPQLIMEASKKLKASSLFDSLSQSIESLISFKSNKISQKNSLKAISIIIKNYKKFLKKNDFRSTKNMQIAANFSGKAISSTSTGAPHALSYYLSSKFNLYHGISVIIWLPTILEYNFKNLDRLDKTKKKKLLNRIDLLKKVFRVDNEMKIINKIQKIIDYTKINILIKNNSINLKDQKKSIKIDRLKNNPIPISYSEILKFNRKVFL